VMVMLFGHRMGPIEGFGRWDLDGDEDVLRSSWFAHSIRLWKRAWG
jgi:hypothetical protein